MLKKFMYFCYYFWLFKFLFLFFILDCYIWKYKGKVDIIIYDFVLRGIVNY